MSKRESEDDKKNHLPGILLGVAIVLAIVAFLVKAVPCIPIPVPGISAGADPAAPAPAKTEEPKKAELPPAQPMGALAPALTIDKPDLGIPNPPIQK